MEHSEPGADKDDATLPVELLLAIAAITDVRTQVKMAFACRDWHVVLLPGAVARVFDDASRSQTDEGGLPFRSVSTDRIAALAQDFLDVGKFSEVSRMSISPRSAGKVLDAAILPRCSSLRWLGIGFLEHADVVKFASIPLPKLEELTLTLAGWSRPVSPAIDFALPSLRKLGLCGNIDRTVLDAFARCCPHVEEISADWYRPVGGSERHLLSWPLLPKITTWYAANPQLLAFLLREAGHFAPRTIEHSGPAPFSHSIGNAWEAVVGCSSVLEVTVAGLDSTDLLISGLPPNLRKLLITDLIPTLHDPEAGVRQAAASLARVPDCTITIVLRFTGEGLPGDEEDLERMQDEVRLWIGHGAEVCLQDEDGEEQRAGGEAALEMLETWAERMGSVVGFTEDEDENEVEDESDDDGSDEGDLYMADELY
ncbi:hypothetical protein DFJ74DRAFT_703262 [Hyaloraphidium curvatum]|nr:hypothetical protein DFJ74DRAFT_703262 [Hyaloraphidium curvatum]